MQLPVDAVLPDILAALRDHGAVVVESPPGSGKTTRVPPAVATSVPGQVWVLEPRRVAARAAAARVAAERGESVGESVGYAMRLDRRAGPATRILYVTEALLSRRLDELPGIDAVILDEFHERSVHTDLALAWVRALRRRRPELKLVVMSATLDGAKLAAWLGCPRVVAEGRLFPVEISWTERKDERRIEERVAAAINTVPGGDVLAFLPGIGEIERCAALLGHLDADVLPLHGELDGPAQDRALRAGPRRRVVLATNVAETSITAEGIHTVVDSGLVRLAGHDAWAGLPTLDLQPISRASAAQRAGRAGRLGPGRCIRLYSRGDHDSRPADHPPELARVDLSGVVLALGGRELDWYEPPPAGPWRAAEQLLRRLGALEAGGRSTLGEAMDALPLPPRLARLLLEAAALGAAREGARLVVLLEGRGRREARDLVEAALAGQGEGPDARRLAALAGGAPRATDPHDALTRAVFAAFPDRVGRREGERIVLAEGGAAGAPVGRPGLVVVTEADRAGTRVSARSFSPIPEAWIADAAEVVESTRWTGDRVEVVEGLRYGAIVLDRALGRGDPAAVAALLYEHARPALHRHLPDWERAQDFAARVAWLRRVGVELPEVDLEALGRRCCEGCRSLADLGAVSALALARAGLDAAKVDRLAPEFVALPGRARAPVRYDGADPHVESRMQDFFGLDDGPRVGPDVPLVLHLLAPNQRPVQVTRDLRGFWARHYPGIRKELMRRYPRHAWPEDPRRGA